MNLPSFPSSFYHQQLVQGYWMLISAPDVLPPMVHILPAQLPQTLPFFPSTFLLVAHTCALSPGKRHTPHADTECTAHSPPFSPMTLVFPHGRSSHGLPPPASFCMCHAHSWDSLPLLLPLSNCAYPPEGSTPALDLPWTISALQRTRFLCPPSTVATNL